MAPPPKRLKKTYNTTEREASIAKLSDLQQARSFIAWYKNMIDNDRNNLSLYLADDAALEWFGRTIRNKKKVAGFLKYDMQSSRHYFSTVDYIEKVELRSDRSLRKDEPQLSKTPNSPELIRSGPEKRKLFRACGSPEWAEGCKPLDEPVTENKIPKKSTPDDTAIQFNVRKRLFSDDSDVDSKGDFGAENGRQKRRCIQAVTPSNEVGQGDCLPSTSGTDSEKSHDTLNAQLPKLGVECNGHVEFMRSKYSVNTDAVKWERKCKLQISYSADPLNVGEYIIWCLRYIDETKCRRNLLAAFEEVALEDSKNI